MDITYLTRLDDPKLKIESIAVIPAAKSRMTSAGDALYQAAKGSEKDKNPFFRPMVVSHIIYTGTSDGNVTRYSCVLAQKTDAESADDNGYYILQEFQHKRKTDLKCGKHPVHCLHADAKMNRVIALCNGSVVMLSATLEESFPVFEKMKSLEGASLLAVAERQEVGSATAGASSNAKLACLVKKTIIQVEYSERSAFPYVPDEETPFVVGDGVTQLAWHGNVLITGSKREYCLYDVRSHQLIDQVLIDKASLGPYLKTVTTKDGPRIACRLGQSIMLYDSKPKGVLDTAEKLTFEEEPVLLNAVYPYIVAIGSSGRLMSISRVDGAEIAMAGFPPVQARVDTALTPCMYVATQKEIVCLPQVPHIKQVSRYVSQGQFDRAVMHFEKTYVKSAKTVVGSPSMANSASASASTADFGSPTQSRGSMSAAFGAAGGEEFDEDEEEAYDDEYHTARKKVHHSCALEAFARGYDAVAFEHFNLSETSCREMIELFPDLVRPGEPNSPAGGRDKARKAWTSEVVRRRERTLSTTPTAEGAEAPPASQAVFAPQTGDSAGTNGPPPPRAYQLLYQYLTRRRIQSEHPSDEQRAVDYALLVMLAHGHVDYDQDEVAALFLPHNALVFSECEGIVTSPMKPSFYTLLLATFGRAAEALQFCEKEGLVQDAVLPLQLGNDPGLYAKHFPWMVVADPLVAVKAVSTPATVSPPASLVLSVLSGIGGQPLREYLHFAVHHSRNKDEPVHTLHAENLIRMVTTLQKFSGSNYSGLNVSAGEEPGLLGELRHDLMAFLASSMYYDSDAVLSQLNLTELLHEQSVVFCRDEDHHAALSVLIHDMKSIPLAIEYCQRLHQKAIRKAAQSSAVGVDARNTAGTISAMKTKMPTSIQNAGLLARARQMKVANDSFGNSSADNSSFYGVNSSSNAPQKSGANNSLTSPLASSSALGTAQQGEQFNEFFTVMLSVLLVPPPGGKPLVDDAIELLDKHSRQISPVSVIKSLPSDVKVPAITPYLKRVIQTQGHKRALLAVRKYSLESHCLASERYLSLLRQRFVYIDEDRPCCVCGKPIGTGVFSVFPNLKVAHFQCAKDKELDPNRGVPFRPGTLY